ncbi:MAG: UDP-glucose 4-epimerase, partial [Candidatus Heimdallarchaeota archaeon]
PEANAEVFNVGGDTPYSVNTLVKVIGEIFGKTPTIKYLRARNEAVHAHSVHKKARKVFGEPSGISLDEGIQKMAVWAQNVGARQSMEFKNIEISENLPQSWEIKKYVEV